jgi:hypothetical protein
MMFEQALSVLLSSLVGGRIYWTTTPDGYLFNNTMIVLQQVGGKGNQYVNNESLPTHKHARIQVTVLGPSKLVVAPLARSVEDAILQSSFVAEIYSAQIDLYDPDLKAFGTTQQFGFWYQPN